MSAIEMIRPAVIQVVPRGPRGIPGAPGDYDYASRSAAIAATIPPTRKTLRTGGYAIEGDGGSALYMRVGAEPSHIGKFQGLDGGWWEIIVEDRLSVCQVGAVAGASDSWAAFDGARRVSQAVLVPPKKQFTLAQPLLLANNENWQIDGRVNGTIQNDGDYFRLYGADLTIAGTPNVWAYPAGTNTFPGSAGAFPAGTRVIVRLAPGAGNALLPDGVTEANQAGFELKQIQSADGTGMTFTTPTRFMYDVPRVQVVNGGFATGIFTRNVSFTMGVPAGMTVTAGMLLILINTTGIDSVRNKTGYFEIKKVATVAAGVITFETPFDFSMINPQVIEMKSTADLRMFGNGYVDNLQLKVTDLVDYRGIKARVIGGDSCYGGSVVEMRANSDQPRGLGFSRCWNMQIGAVYSHGSRGSTDNAAFKTLGNVNCIFDGYMVYDTASSDPVQIIYQRFDDFYVPPWYGWEQNCVFKGGKGTMPSAGGNVSATTAGLRDCMVNQMIMASNIRIEYCDGVIGAQYMTTGQIELKDSTGIQMSQFQCGNLVYSGLKNSIISSGIVTGQHPTTFHALWVKGGTIFASTLDVLTVDVKFLSANLAGDAIGVQACDDLTFRNCSDVQGLTKSFNVLSSGSVGSKIQIEGRGLKNPIDSVPGAWQPTAFGGTVSGALTYGAGTNGAAQRNGRFIEIRGSTVVAIMPGSGFPTGMINIRLPKKAKNSPSAAQALWVTLSGTPITGTQVFAQLQPGNDFISLQQTSAAGVDSAIVWPAAPTTLVIRFGGFYEVENYADGT